MLINNTKLKLLGMLFIISLSSSQVHAATKQIFGGTLCKSLYNVNEVYGENIDYQYGSIFNESSTRWGYINCPVPRANGYSSGNVLDLEVSVTDTNGNMWCSAQVRDRYGNVTGSETAYSSGTGNRILDFGSVPGGAPYEGFVDLFCVLPMDGGAIHSISVDFN